VGEGVILSIIKSDGSNVREKLRDVNVYRELSEDEDEVFSQKKRAGIQSLRTSERLRGSFVAVLDFEARVREKFVSIECLKSPQAQNFVGNIGQNLVNLTFCNSHQTFSVPDIIDI
jgi:hypothetical protein